MKKARVDEILFIWYHSGGILPVFPWDKENIVRMRSFYPKVPIYLISDASSGSLPVIRWPVSLLQHDKLPNKTTRHSDYTLRDYYRFIWCMEKPYRLYMDMDTHIFTPLPAVDPGKIGFHGIELIYSNDCPEKIKPVFDKYFGRWVLLDAEKDFAEIGENFSGKAFITHKKGA